MKYLLYVLLLVFATACTTDEDTLRNTLDFPNEFAITDDPNDSVQHERYRLYKEYGVSVYFNDTLTRKPKGTDYKGNPVYAYETLDLNWSYTDYNNGVKYTYVYLTDSAQQMQALRYARRYLEQVSKPMRPFSIMLADTLTVTSGSKVEQPTHHIGARTLVFAQMLDVTDEHAMDERFFDVIRGMVYDRVKVNREVVARFALSGTQNSWYGKEWKKLDCPTISSWITKSWVFNPNVLYNEAPYNPYNHEDLVTLLLRTSPTTGEPYVASYDEAVEVRTKMIAEMGKYGFICGWKQGGSYAPSNSEEDREQFLLTIMTLGEEGFKARYGSSPLVMEKYRILADFLTKDLGINLEYDGRTEE